MILNKKHQLVEKISRISLKENVDCKMQSILTQTHPSLSKQHPRTSNKGCSRRDAQPNHRRQALQAYAVFVNFAKDAVKHDRHRHTTERHDARTCRLLSHPSALPDLLSSSTGGHLLLSVRVTEKRTLIHRIFQTSPLATVRRVTMILLRQNPTLLSPQQWSTIDKARDGTRVELSLTHCSFQMNSI